MPNYDYECGACSHSFEAFQSMMDAKVKTCPKCQKDELVRLIGAGSGVVFKGSGFYETDYKTKSPSSEPAPPPACSESSCPKKQEGSCPAAQ